MASFAYTFFVLIEFILASTLELALSNAVGRYIDICDNRLCSLVTVVVLVRALLMRWFLSLLCCRLLSTLSETENCSLTLFGGESVTARRVLF